MVSVLDCCWICDGDLFSVSPLLGLVGSSVGPGAATPTAFTIGITEKQDPGPVGQDPNGPDPGRIPIHFHVSR